MWLKSQILSQLNIGHSSSLIPKKERLAFKDQINNLSIVIICLTMIIVVDCSYTLIQSSEVITLDKINSVLLTIILRIGTLLPIFAIFLLYILQHRKKV